MRYREGKLKRKESFGEGEGEGEREKKKEKWRSRSCVLIFKTSCALDIVLRNKMKI